MLGAALSAGTLGSALTRNLAGRLIRLTTVRRYTLCVVTLLSLACQLAPARELVAVPALW
jgi:hypothetical protein